MDELLTLLALSVGLLATLLVISDAWRRRQRR